MLDVCARLDGCDLGPLCCELSLLPPGLKSCKLIPGTGAEDTIADDSDWCRIIFSHGLCVL